MVVQIGDFNVFKNIQYVWWCGIWKELYWVVILKNVASMVPNMVIGEQLVFQW